MQAYHAKHFIKIGIYDISCKKLWHITTFLGLIYHNSIKGGLTTKCNFKCII